MANKRIRDLSAVTVIPNGAIFPLDAYGLSEANGISSSDLIDAVSLLLIPQLTPKDDGAASANSDAIDTALQTYALSENVKGVLRLPRGLVYLARAIKLTAAHSGLTIDGDGCTLVNAQSTGWPSQAICVVGFASENDPTGYADEFDLPDHPYTAHTITFRDNVSLDNYHVGDALLVFAPDLSATSRVSPQQTVTISSVGLHTVTVNETLVAGLTAAKWLHNGVKTISEGVAAGATQIAV